MNDPAVLEAGAADADGVIHLASSDFNDFDKMVAEETRAIDALTGALRGSGKALVIAGFTPVLPGRLSTEDDPESARGPDGGPRAERAEGARLGSGRRALCGHPLAPVGPRAQPRRRLRLRRRAHPGRPSHRSIRICR